MKIFAALNLADKLKSSGSMYSTLVYLDNALNTLDVVEMNGIQVKTILQQEGWDINANGVVTPSDVASQIKQYGLACTAFPAASGTLAAPWGVFDTFFVDAYVKMQFTALPTAETLLYRRKNELDEARLTLGIHPDNGFFCELGPTRYYAPSFDWTQFFTSRVLDEWFDFGVCLAVDSGHIHFYLNGQVSIEDSPSAPVYDDIPEATSETIEIGGEGIRYAMIAFVTSGFSRILVPSDGSPLKTFPPLARQRLPFTASYYDCRPGEVSNKLYDRAVSASSHRCDLTITNGAIVEMLMI